MNRLTSFAAHHVQAFLRRRGYEIRPRSASRDSAPLLWYWVRDTQSIRTFVDVGANTGDFAASVGPFLGARTIHVFEPLRSCQPSLAEKASRLPAFHVHDVALSDRPGEEEFFENAYGPSSSLLRVGEIHKNEFPQTATETPTRVRVARLDDELDAASLEPNVFVKLDVQGLEDRVISGGTRLFALARVVLVEMSFAEMYATQPLFEGVHDRLVEHGLRLAGLKNQVCSSSSGQPLFAHCLYLRDERGGPPEPAA